ncbi:MAG: hypothetical protein LBL13_06385 [Bacteroidales bacterium]|nr:hypothetical protein [Bacteroidales bacterium]
MNRKVLHLFSRLPKQGKKAASKKAASKKAASNTQHATSGQAERKSATCNM